jgi:hypothetical protein
MRIKIPYDLIGNLKEVNFVAFILDSNNSAVYRTDINRIFNEKFFSKKIKYIDVSDEYYDKCDTIVFYPQYKNGNWGDKIIKRKHSENFFIPDGGLSLVKNKNSVGNVELAKKWIFDGISIESNDNVVGKKNLIYFTFFGDKVYAQLMRLLLSTLKKQPYQNFDLLFITDKKTLLEIKKTKEIKHFNVDYMILPAIDDPVNASFQKLKIYDYKKIDDYAKILFLDLDILVVGDLSMVFEERTRPNIFYSGSHRLVQGHHKTVYHRLIDYSQVELDRMEKNGIFAFNAGQFFFKNTITMRKHFENINGFISKWNGEYFFEQSFINCYFNVLNISNVFKFKEQFGFVSINQNESNTKFGPETVFVHFMGSAGDGHDKLSFIKTYYSHLL